MLAQFTLRRVGFDKSLKINDVFESKGDYWIIRSIANSEVKSRIVKGFGGQRGRQWDVIKSEAIAQKVGTCDIQNLTSKTTEMTFSVSTAKIDFSDDLVRVGDVTSCNDGRTYVLIEIKEIKYKFTDIYMEFVGKSITEILIPETKKLMSNHKLNELGWEILRKPTRVQTVLGGHQ